MTTLMYACMAKFSRLLGQCNNLHSSRNQTITTQTCKAPQRKCRGKSRGKWRQQKAAIEHQQQSPSVRRCCSVLVLHRLLNGNQWKLPASTRSHIVWLIAGKSVPSYRLANRSFFPNFGAPIEWQRLSDRTWMSRTLWWVSRNRGFLENLGTKAFFEVKNFRIFSYMNIKGLNMSKVALSYMFKYYFKMFILFNLILKFLIYKK